MQLSLYWVAEQVSGAKARPLGRGWAGVSVTRPFNWREICLDTMKT
jgi:hypothetical protein